MTLYSGSSTTLKLYGGTIKSVKSSRTSVATISKSGKLTRQEGRLRHHLRLQHQEQAVHLQGDGQGSSERQQGGPAGGDYTKIYLRGATLKSVKTSSTSVATVSKDGKYIVIRAKKKGSATITAYDTGKHKYSCSVRVEAPPQ